MKNTALYFLHKVAEKHQENLFARAIFNRFNEAGDDADFKSWQLLDTDLGNVAPLGDYDPSQIERKQDFRFLHLYLRNFRKFPSLSENRYYGVSFKKEEKDVPENTLLQGRNGTGKTSLFDALEYLFTRNVSAATKMGFSTTVNQKDYLPYAGRLFNDVDIGVITHSSNFKLLPLVTLSQDDVRQLCLLPFFCSEYDVDRLIGSKYEEDKLTKFIYEQMGYGLVKWIIDEVKKELDEAKSQHEELVNISDDIESQVDDLDKSINMNVRLRPSFIYLAVGLNNKKIPKNNLDSLKNCLSDELNRNEILGEQFRSEKKLLTEILGENSTLIGMYKELEEIKLEEIKNTNTEKPQDPLLYTNDKGKIDETLNNLKYARSSLSKFIDILFDRGENDVNSTINEFDNFIQNQKKEKENRNDLLKNSRLMANIASYGEFWTFLKDIVYEAIETNTKKACEMLNETMNLFVMEDEKMQFSFDKDNGTFSMGITLSDSDGKSIASFTPEKYLNTFRYKLYCMSLKMAIAFSMKRFYQINFPIVIDDIFYSSDFTHRSMVRTYFRILFKKHKDLFPEPKDELQVIFLSHDEVIIEAASRGIRDAGTNANRQILFDYRDADEKPIYVLTNDGQIIKFIKLTCDL